MPTTKISGAKSVEPQIVEWKKLGQAIFVKCPKCETFRGVSREQLNKLIRGSRRNICASCSSKEKLNVANTRRKRMTEEEKSRNKKIDFTCAACGAVRKIRKATLFSYKSRGEEPWCQKCKGLKLCSTSIIARPIMGPFPVIEGPSREVGNICYVCHGSYFGKPCHRYDACLDWVVATNMQSFVCGLPGQVRVTELSPSREALALAYEQSVLEGFLPEQT